MRHPLSPRALLTTALASWLIGAVALLSCGCTIAGGRTVFAISLAADMGTTQYGISHGYAELNPVMKVNPLIIGVATSLLVILAAEYVNAHGAANIAVMLYAFAAAIHFAAAGWNAYQLTKAPVTCSY